MDFKNPVSNQKSDRPIENRQPSDELLIRTMKGDLALLGKGSSSVQNDAGFKKASPPDKLPVMESIRKPGESIVGAVRPKEEARKETGIKTEIDRAKSKLEQWGKATSVPIKPRAETIKKEKSYLGLVLGGALLILVLAAAGGFLYWKGHRQISVHLVCQDFQCVEIQGEGEDECLLNGNCLPAEPVLPQSLIFSWSTKTIEINKGEEESFWDKLKLSLGEDENENVLERVLIKIVDGFAKEYVNWNKFVSLTAINIPSVLALLIEQSEVNGENYTFFVYKQSKGERLGLVIKLKDNVEAAETMKGWEKDIKDDLSSLFLGLDIPDLAVEFNDNVYQGKNIRYVNFPDPDLSIDYAIVDDKLLIATSRESMYAVIDALSSF